ncbi:MAG: LysR family transcriptional regulator [Rhizobiaceae bacterium]
MHKQTKWAHTVSYMEAIDTLALGGLRAFLIVTQTGGFSRAAEKLGVQRAAVSKQIAQLEDMLGQKLFERTTRKVALTEDGEALLAAIKSPVENLRNALLSAQSKTTDVSGLLRVSVSHAFGRKFILPALTKFRSAYPKIVISLNMADGINDLIDDQIDLAIRLGPLPDSSMVAKKLGDLPVVLAVPTSLGVNPSLVSDLADLPAIAYRIPGSGTLYHWVLQKADERHYVVPENIVLTTNSIEGVSDLVIAGHGLAPVPTFLISEALATDKVRAAMTGYRLPPVPVHLCFTGTRLVPRRLRALIDFLSANIVL